MTGAPAALRDDAPAPVPASPRRGRRIGVWIAIAVVILLVGAAGGALAGLGRWVERDALDPDSPAPAGTRAIAEILRDQGVQVVVPRSRADAASALAGADATLVLPDAPALSDEGLEDLAEAASDVVLIDPRSRTLRLFLPGAETVGVAPGDAVAAECADPAAQRAGAVTIGVTFAPGASQTACFPVDGGWGLLTSSDDDRRVSALDGRAILANDALAQEGNAALAVNLLGRHAVVVWYMPSLADTDLENTAPTLGELTPPWVSPVIVLLLAAGLAAALWRGRRFGPLVTERLPVTVRVSETTEGRARLYATAGDPGHAAAQVRRGALARLAGSVGLSRTASADDVATAVAALLGADPRVVRGILIHDMPDTDAALVDLYTRVRALEAAVRTARHPERNRE